MEDMVVLVVAAVVVNAAWLVPAWLWGRMERRRGDR